MLLPRYKILSLCGLFGSSPLTSNNIPVVNGLPYGKDDEGSAKGIKVEGSLSTENVAEALVMKPEQEM